MNRQTRTILHNYDQYGQHNDHKRDPVDLNKHNFLLGGKYE
jgi:hypothetical protein